MIHDTGGRPADARISLTRPRDWSGRYRKIEVLVDGEVAARVSSGETIVFSVEPGHHRLQLKMDWCTSPELEIVAEAGDTHHYRSKSPSVWRGPKLMLSQPESFFQLLPEDGQAS